MPFILPGNVATATAAVGYNVANSCRFNRADAAYMSKTPGSGGSDTIATFSAWIKVAITGDYNGIFTSYSSVTNFFEIDFNNLANLEVRSKASNSYNLRKITDAEFRDPSAWMHICVGIDTTDGVAEDRVKIYVNGVRITSFSTNTTAGSSTDLKLNNTGYEHRVALDEWSTPNHFNGYMAEVYWIDGTVYAASDFGEFDEDSPTIWKPKDASGDLTFGTNGFYLDFADSDNLGDDESGNTLDLAETNLAAADQATDTPTNNFCTLNPLSLFHSNTPTLSQGNCRHAGTATDEFGVSGTMGVSSGKWYFEYKKISQDGGADDDSQRHVVGIGSRAYRDLATYSDDETWMLHGNSIIQNGTNGGVTVTGESMLSDDGIIQIALDLDNNRVAFGFDNAWQTGSNAWSGSYSDYESITAPASTGSGFYFPIISDLSSSRAYTGDINFGGCPAFAISSAANDGNGYGTFEFAPPSGFLALCTKNLGSDGG